MLNFLRFPSPSPRVITQGVAAMAATGAAYSGALAAGEGGFALLSATLLSAELGETDVMVFVAPQGTAAAVELSERGPQVLTGLAAGALLSEVEEAAEPLRLADRASPAAAAAMIDAMVALNDDQRAKLRGALSL